MFVEFAFTVFFVVIMIALIVLLRYLDKTIRPELVAWLADQGKEREAQILDLLAGYGVQLAEQLAGGESGEKKLALALAMTEQMAARYGIEISAEELRPLIEAKVFELLNRYKPGAAMMAIPVN